MVQQSNNDSWALILAAVGHKGLTDYAASLGIPYDRTVNGLTPAEMAKTLSELYSGRLLNAAQHRPAAVLHAEHQLRSADPGRRPRRASRSSTSTVCSSAISTTPASWSRASRAFVFVVYTLGQDMSDMAPRTRVIQQLTRHCHRRTVLS